jgi:hypothetical protein
VGPGVGPGGGGGVGPGVGPGGGGGVGPGVGPGGEGGPGWTQSAFFGNGQHANSSAAEGQVDPSAQQELPAQPLLDPGQETGSPTLQAVINDWFTHWNGSKSCFGWKSWKLSHTHCGTALPGFSAFFCVALPLSFKICSTFPRPFKKTASGAINDASRWSGATIADWTTTG